MLAFHVIETDLLLHYRDPTFRAVACHSGLRPTNFPAAHAVYTITQTPLQNLAHLFALFGSVRAVICTRKLLANIIVFTSAEAALRAKEFQFSQPPIIVRE